MFEEFKYDLSTLTIFQTRDLLDWTDEAVDGTEYNLDEPSTFFDRRCEGESMQEVSQRNRDIISRIYEIPGMRPYRSPRTHFVKLNLAYLSDSFKGL